MAETLLGRFQAITGASHEEIAQVVGRSRPWVSMVIRGDTPEYLDAHQTKAVLDAARLQRDRLIEGVAELEMLV